MRRQNRPAHTSHTNVEVSNDRAVRLYNTNAGPGRTIDLFAILAQHQRSEKMAKKKLQPAIRVTGTAEIDTEAEALCDILDGVSDSPSLEKFSRKSSFPQLLEW